MFTSRTVARCKTCCGLKHSQESCSKVLWHFSHRRITMAQIAKRFCCNHVQATEHAQSIVNNPPKPNTEPNHMTSKVNRTACNHLASLYSQNWVSITDTQHLLLFSPATLTDVWKGRALLQSTTEHTVCRDKAQTAPWISWTISGFLRLLHISEHNVEHPR